MVVLEKSPSVMLVALFLRGFWLEVSADDTGHTKARYLYGKNLVGELFVGQC